MALLFLLAGNPSKFWMILSLLLGVFTLIVDIAFYVFVRTAMVGLGHELVTTTSMGTGELYFYLFLRS